MQIEEEIRGIMPMIIDKLKMQDAVTLTAVIVTVIIILILAGVTLSLITGSDGILEKSKASVSAYKEQSIREKVELKIADLNLQKMNMQAKSATMKDLLELQGKDEEITDVYQTGDNVMLIIDGYKCEINSNLEIESIYVYKPERELRKAQRTLTFCTIDREI